MNREWGLDGLIGTPLFRVATRYTLGLWLAGYALLELSVWATGRTLHWAMPLYSITYLAPATLMAILLQLLVMATEGWRTGRRMATVGAAAVACAALAGAIDTVSLWWASVRIWPGLMPWAELSLADSIRASFLYGWVYCLNAAMVMLVIAGERAKAQQQAVIAAQTGEQAAQLAMLRYQINPHFLFNTLNAISSLVVTGDNDRAEEMIGRLSSFLRATIATAPEGLIPLDDELGIIEGYLEVEEARFGERLVVEIACEPAARRVPVPSFLLQPIIENAVKYAVAPQTRPVTIRIEASVANATLTVSVEDDGGGAPAAASGGTGIGLANVRSRLATVYGRGASLVAGTAAGGYRVELRMPVRG